MKRSTLSVVLAVLPTGLLVGAVAACGGDDGISVVVDASDGDGSVDGPPPIDAPAVCTVSNRDFGDLGALTPTQCVQDPGEDTTTPADDVIVLKAPLEGGSPYDELEIQLWAGYGALAGGFATGTFPITGDELRYSTCGICLFVNSDRSDPETYVDDYFATGGSITFTSVEGTLTGSVSGLTFEHVFFEEGDSVSADDGCTTAIGAASFTAPLEAPPMGKAAVPASSPRRVKRGRAL